MGSSTSAVLVPVLGEGSTTPPAPPDYGDEPPRPPRGEPLAPPVSNAKLAMLAFIVFESMLFAGLLGGYTVLRWGSAVWPPAGQPYLPIAVTWINTFVLLGSCVPLALAGRAFRRMRIHASRIDDAAGVMDRRRAMVLGLAVATLMGALFLAIQGYEWLRLLAHGMTIAKGVYGGIFLILIGTHAVHVLGAVLWLGLVTVLASAGRIAARGSALDMVTMYWRFVCAVWIALFAMVYLA